VAGSSFGQFRTRVNLAGGFPDGAINTIMVGERYAVPFKVDPSTNTVYQDGNWYWDCGLNGTFYSSFDKFAALQESPTLNPADHIYYKVAYYPNLHAPRAEGLLVCLADASARLVSGQIDIYTWQSACDPTDGRALGPDWQTQ